MGLIETLTDRSGIEKDPNQAGSFGSEPLVIK